MSAACHDDPAPERGAPTGLRRIALIGSPNAGKTTIFNQLTGLRAHTANYPGVTVTRSEGMAHTPAGRVAVEDVPGTYSLSAMSPDEQVVVDLLDGTLPGCPTPDALVVVLDATTLRRSLTLAAQAMARHQPTLVAVTMLDEHAVRGGRLDMPALAEALGVGVVGVIPPSGEGIAELRARLDRPQDWAEPPFPPPADSEEQTAWVRSVLAAADYHAPRPDATTRAVDDVLLHPLWGGVVFVAVMFAFFQTIFTVAAPIQDTLQRGLGWLAEQVADHVGHGFVGAFLSEAVIGGVGSVLVFVPQVALLFLLIALLEGLGYMARAAYLMDRIMAATGLDGRAFVAMLSSFACAVPGIMATRTIGSAAGLHPPRRAARAVGDPLGTGAGPGSGDVRPLRPRWAVRDGLRPGAALHRSARRAGALLPGDAAVPDAPAALGAALLVELGADVPPQGRDDHLRHRRRPLGAARLPHPRRRDRRPGPGARQLLRPRAQLCRPARSGHRAGLRAARLRLADQCRRALLARRARGIRGHDGSGGRRDQPGIAAHRVVADAGGGRETGSWRWPALALTYLTLIAYAAAWLARLITLAVTT